ncbi:hypothetical protein SELMODRAFT_421956 [Selaginella moellendorffii]|uniref:Uncharacterized protein n=1 Tax=Selaginella moellendorffii TaxID=88036 RepID=D8SGW6_SELML|nr:hypothetical protein SELMODRAFT_421956 [Selaginella moellendorffii]
MAMTHALSTGGGFSSRTRAKARLSRNWKHDQSYWLDSNFGFGSNGNGLPDEASSSLSTVVDINYTRRISDSSSNEIEQRLSPGIEEAMHLSSLDMSSGDFSRKEIPMQGAANPSFGSFTPLRDTPGVPFETYGTLSVRSIEFARFLCRLRYCIRKKQRLALDSIGRQPGNKPDAMARDGTQSVLSKGFPIWINVCDETPYDILLVSAKGLKRSLQL